MNAHLLLPMLGMIRPSGQIARTFGVDWIHLGAQIISFCILCAVLHRFAYRPVLGMLDKRRQLIAQGLADAEKSKAELASTEAKCQDLIVQANVRIQRMIEDAQTAAARVQERETQKALVAAGQIMVKAREEALQEHARMLEELKREVGRLVVQTTAKVTGKILTPQDEQRLADETATQIGA